MSVKKKFAIIGLGTFGSQVAIDLANQRAEVIAIDQSAERVDSLKGLIEEVFQLDASNRLQLSKVLGSHIHTAIISTGDSMEPSIMAAYNCAKLGIPEIIVKALSNEHQQILEMVGATRIVYPEKEAATRLAGRLLSSNLLDYIPVSADFSIAEISAPSFMVGKTLADLNLRRQFAIQVIAIKCAAQGGEQIHLLDVAQHLIGGGDRLIVAGRQDEILRLQEER